MTLAELAEAVSRILGQADETRAIVQQAMQIHAALGSTARGRQNTRQRARAERSPRSERRRGPYQRDLSDVESAFYAALRASRWRDDHCRNGPPIGWQTFLARYVRDLVVETYARQPDKFAVAILGVLHGYKPSEIDVLTGKAFDWTTFVRTARDLRRKLRRDWHDRHGYGFDWFDAKQRERQVVYRVLEQLLSLTAGSVDLSDAGFQFTDERHNAEGQPDTAKQSRQILHIALSPGIFGLVASQNRKTAEAEAHGETKHVSVQRRPGRLPLPSEMMRVPRVASPCPVFPLKQARIQVLLPAASAAEPTWSPADNAVRPATGVRDPARRQVLHLVAVKRRYNVRAILEGGEPQALADFPMPVEETLRAVTVPAEKADPDADSNDPEFVEITETNLYRVCPGGVQRR